MRAKLRPFKVSGDIGKPWCLKIPASLSQTGREQRLFFAAEKEAERHASDIRKGRSTFGDLLSRVTQHQLSEAVRAFELLAPTGTSLLDAVESFLGPSERSSASVTLDEAFTAFVKRPGRKLSTSYQLSVRHTHALFEPLLDRKIVDVTLDDLESHLSGLPESTRGLRINRLRSIFRYAVKKGWLETNVTDRLDSSRSVAKEVQIYAVEDVRKLLQTAFDKEPEILPFLGVCAFAGLRPENEAFNLNWASVHLRAERPHLVVKADTSKTRERRTVDLSGNAVEWIDATMPREVGRVVPFSAATLKRKRASLLSAAGVDWIKDGLRHTFASAHLAKFGDATKTMLSLGHKDLKMVWRHYYRHMTPEDADKFFSIRPEV